MTTTALPARASWRVLLLAALAVVLALLLPSVPALAAALPAAETRVGASGPATTVAVGVHECITAGQRPVRGPSQLQIVVGNCVAAEAGLAGSGPVSGVLEVSGRVKSVGAFRNYNPKGGVEYVFDPATSRFVVGRPGAGSGLKGSPHQQLADSIGADHSGVVGGMLRRGPGGEFVTDEMSGHFYRNWTPEIRSQFGDFMQGFELNVVH